MDPRWIYPGTDREITEGTILIAVLFVPLSLIRFRFWDYSAPKLIAVEGDNDQRRSLTILVTNASELPALVFWNALVVVGKLSDEVFPAT
jgi:hypothetical protein